MKTLIQTFFNGNLCDARKLAKKYSKPAICRALEEMAGHSLDKAILGATYLKTGKFWQEYCDCP